MSIARKFYFPELHFQRIVSQKPACEKIAYTEDVLYSLHSLQVCLDSEAKKVLLPITSAADLGTVPSELVGSFNLIFYSSPEDAVFKALGVE